MAYVIGTLLGPTVIQLGEMAVRRHKVRAVVHSGNGPSGVRLGLQKAGRPGLAWHQLAKQNP